MSWPIRMRATSFAITFASVTVEVAMVTLPLAAIAWACGLATAAHACQVALAVALGYAAAIAIYTHLSPLGIRRRALDGDS